VYFSLLLVFLKEVPGAGFRVPGSGFRVPGSGCHVPGVMFRVPGAMFPVLRAMCQPEFSIFRGNNSRKINLGLGWHPAPGTIFFSEMNQTGQLITPVKHQAYFSLSISISCPN
jgi:hypothetical protein